MPGMLTFLTQEIKGKKMSVDDFCNEISISRQKFYRFVKEPRRFMPDTLKAICEVLDFTPEKTSQLYSYCDRQASFPLKRAQQEPQVLMKGNQRQSDTKQKIKNLLTARSTLNGIEEKSLLEYEYYDMNQSVSKLTAQATAQKIIDSINLRPFGEAINRNEGHIHHNYTITIYNCISNDYSADSSNNSTENSEVPIGSTTILSDLFYHLEDRVDKKNEEENTSDSVHLRISHFINENEDNCSTEQEDGSSISDKDSRLNKQLYLFNVLLPLIASSDDYKYTTEKLIRPIWTVQNNFCLIKYSQLYVPNGFTVQETRDKYRKADKTKEYSYFFINFSGKGKAYICPLGDEKAEYLYHFLTLDTRGRVKGYNTFGDVSNTNRILYEKHLNFDSILVHNDLCFDNIPTSVWMNLIQNLTFSNDLQKQLAKVFALDTQYHSDDFIKTFNDSLLPFLQARFDINESKGNICIINYHGLNRFVQNRMTSDLYESVGRQFQVLFSNEQMRAILEYLRTSIEERMKGNKNVQQFYITSPVVSLFDYAYTIFHQNSVMVSDLKSRHLTVAASFFNDSNIADTLFDYLVNEWIEKRGKALSDIMSDEESLSFIRDLEKRF